ncbi:uncharacterized protein LOC121255368 isoform X2 [Juglans microcarpa x Juglans regia]|uniref:uncharacterized protein LOC121255368 isoform X2 n=1 Tax=Juglans microcarpa x Juglans regia TaxID=2249226 RepID=UPI001B7F1C3F|nr:uncharacterized protein LOC121255368 isoform X2 [Juglans microcarpa x Juglans regia]
MPPRAVKRLYTASTTALKKRPRLRQSVSVSREPSAPPIEEKGLERLELEDNDRQFEAEENGGGNLDMEELVEMDGRNEEDGVERIDVDDMIEEIVEVEVEEDEEVEEEEEVVEEDVGDEREEIEDYEEEHHDVVKERRKRKEFEVFVGGLDRDATEEDLRKVFSQVGMITEVRLLKNPVTHKNKGFAFLRFETVEQARRAIYELKHPVVNGKQCGVAPSQDSDTLFVGNICKAWEKDILKEKLAHYGVYKYEELTLVEDMNNEGMNRGFAFLDFSCRADALEACKRLQKRDVVFGTDRTARVAFADTFIEPDDEIMSHVRTVFLDGLPPAWDEDHVKNYLKKFGKIEKVELARNMPAAKRTDFGFITFDSHAAAMACVDGVNNAELGDGDRKLKVRARLSRPRQRGKSARQARGGYVVAHGSGRGDRGPWGSSISRIDHRRSIDHGGRSIQSRGDGVSNRSYGPRDRDVVSYGLGSGQQYSSPERSYGRRSTVQVYGKTGSKRDYILEDEVLSRPADFGRAPFNRLSYRDAYPSRGSGYSGSPPRQVSRAATRRPSPPYDDYGYGRYVERPSNYRDSYIHDYSSTTSSKRPHSAIEEDHSHYAEASIRQSRACFDYGGSSSDLPFSDKSYGSNFTRLGRGSRPGYNEGSRRSTGQSHGVYVTKSSTMGYKRVLTDEISRRDRERVYAKYGRDYMSRDYEPSRSDLDEGAYPPDYPSRRLNDDYFSGRSSGSYY